MRADLTLREAGEADVAGVLTLYRACVATPGCRWTNDYPDEDIVRGDIAAHALYIAVDEDGAPLAAASVHSAEEDGLPFWSADHAGMLSRVGVRPDGQGQGIGAWITRQALDILREKGYPSARLMVYEGNESAMRLYRSCGFHGVGHTDMYDTHWLCMEHAL